MMTWFRVLSFCPFSFVVSNHSGRRSSSPSLRPHIASVDFNSVGLIPNFSSGFVSTTFVVLSGIVNVGTSLASSASRFADVPCSPWVTCSFFDARAGATVLNFCVAQFLASTVGGDRKSSMAQNCFGSGAFLDTQHARRKFLQCTVLMSSWSSRISIRSYTTSADRSLLKPS